VQLVGVSGLCSVWKDKGYSCLKNRKRKKNYAGSETTPCISSGKGDTLARRAVSLLEELHQGKIRTSEDLEGGKPPPAPDQDLESNCFSQERVWL